MDKSATRRLQRVDAAVEFRKQGASYAVIGERLAISPKAARNLVQLDENWTQFLEDNELRQVVIGSLNEITGRELRQTNYVEFFTTPPKVRCFATGVDLVIGALGAVIGYCHSLHVAHDQAIAQEQDIANDLLQRAQEQWKENPSAVICHNEIFARAECGSLVSEPTRTWVLDPKDQQYKFELRLHFANSNGGRLDILVRPGGEPNRVPTKRTVKKLLAPYAFRRLYFPQNAIDNPKWVRDAVALILIYIAQKNLIDFDLDRETLDWLLSYLNSYRQVGSNHQGVNAIALLGELIKNLLIVEDYRSFRKYVAITAFGMSSSEMDDMPTAEEFKEDALPGETDLDRDLRISRPAMGVAEAATYVSLSKRRMYELVRNRTVKSEKQTKEPLSINAAEIQILKQRLKMKSARQELIAYLAETKQIDRASAWRWVRRQENKGMTLKQIYLKIKSSEREASAVKPD